MQASQKEGNILDTLQRSAPTSQISSLLEEIKSLHEKRLWHNVTIKLVELVETPEMNGSSNLIPLYTEYIKGVETKMNQLTRAKLIIAVSQAYSKKEALEFLEESATKIGSVEGNEEPFMLIRSVLVQLKLKLDPSSSMSECKTILETTQSTLDNMAGVDTAVYSNFYRAQADYWKIKNQPTEYYKYALLFLSYTPIESLTDARKQEIAYDLGLSALIGEEIFNFGDLLAHPIVGSLDNTDKEWLAHLLRAFNRGDITKYEGLVVTYQNQLGNEPLLVEAVDMLKEKISILSLIELAFERQAISRDISFQMISERTKLPLDMVELLVMKALSVNLIKGHIDEVQQLVRVSWVQPRVLGMDQIIKMKDMLDVWTKKVHSTLVFVEQGTPDLFS